MALCWRNPFRDTPRKNTKGDPGRCRHQRPAPAAVAVINTSRANIFILLRVQGCQMRFLANPLDKSAKISSIPSLLQAFPPDRFDISQAAARNRSSQFSRHAILLLSITCPVPCLAAFRTAFLSGKRPMALTHVNAGSRGIAQNSLTNRRRFPNRTALEGVGLMYTNILVVTAGSETATRAVGRTAPQPAVTS